MRAIIRCNCEVRLEKDRLDISSHLDDLGNPDDRLYVYGHQLTPSDRVLRAILAAVLGEMGWLPPVGQDHQDVKKWTDLILKTVPEDKRQMVQDCHMFTIQQSPTNTWGIVSKGASDNTVTFRFKQPVMIKLHQATKTFVEAFNNNRQIPIVFDADHNKFRVPKSGKPVGDGATFGHVVFHFNPRVDVHEPENDEHAHWGEIVPKKGRWKLAIREKRIEFGLGLFFLVASAMLFPFRNYSFGEKLLITLLVSCATQSLNVMIYFVYLLSEKNVIRWETDKISPS